MSEDVEFYAAWQGWYEGVDLSARVRTGESYGVIQPLMLQNHDPKHTVNPFVTLSKQSAQNLIDELWKCGIRPSNGEGSAGQLNATEKHLEDMRTLVFKDGE